MPPQRRQREYETAVEADAIHAPVEKLAGFGEKREVIKTAELEELRNQAQQAERLREQLTQALAQQGQGSSALAVQEDGSLRIHDFEFTPTGLLIPENVTVEAWTEIGHLLFRLEGSIQWLLGDWLVFGEDLHWGDITAIANQLGYEPSTLWSYASVCRAVQPLIRIKDLSFAHHRLVMKLSPDEQNQALRHAALNKLTVAAFRQLLRGEVEQPALPAGDASDIVSVSRNVHKFMQRDPSTFEQKDIQAAREYAEQLYRTAEALKRHAGISD